MNTTHPILLLFLLFFGFSAHTQNESTLLGQGEINEKYLEHLIKIKIDSVRFAHDCQPLVNDSILYIAAEHHSNFMQINKRLTHYEDESPTTNSPQLRAEFYGAKNYFVGENVLKTKVNANIKSKKAKVSGNKARVIHTNTYGSLATSIVYGWVNSPGHFKNIINPEYQITGVSINSKGGTIFACQKFATVLYKYNFTESPTLFQYSDYIPKPAITSFNNVEKALIAHYKYEWNLSHDSQEKCTDCEKQINDPPYLTLRYEKGDFILRVENSEFVQNIIQDKKDGFAVEIVEYNDYACGNPEYYEKPSRRNEQLKTNGILIKPLYRNELSKGYKKRKKKKDVKFLSYLFGADSVKFKNRFPNYKMAQYSSEYFEIKLGKLPKDISGLWAHNLIYIQDGEICHIDYFTGHCSDLYMDTVAFDFMPLDTHAIPFKFQDQKKRKYFEIPFEQNKSTYSKKDIAPFIESLKNVDYTVDSIHIKASASVEGDSISNHALLRKRASSILAVWQNNQKRTIKTKVETEIAWNHFYSKIRANAKYRELGRADKATVIKALNDSKTQEALEPILAAERKANITLFISVPPSDKNLEFLIQENLNEIDQILNQAEISPEQQKSALDDLNSLYALAHQKAVEGKISIDFFASLKLPIIYKSDIRLMEKFLLYGCEFPKAFTKNEQWSKDREGIRILLAQQPVKDVSPVFWYDHAYLITRELINSKKITQDKIQVALDVLQPLRNFYYSDTIAQNNIESLNFNLNMMLLNMVFPSDPIANTEGAETALDQVALYYAKHDTTSAERILNMARMSVYYNNTVQAQRLTIPYLDKPKVIQYIVPLAYTHSSAPLSNLYYAYLIELSKTMDKSIWCNMFMNNCGIPFQAFDHEDLRNTFCEACQEENEYLKGQ